jgi:hypothetical protein
MVETGLLMHLGYHDWALFNINSLIQSRLDLPDSHDEVQFLRATRDKIASKAKKGEVAVERDVSEGEEIVTCAIGGSSKPLLVPVSTFMDLCSKAAAAGDKAFFEDGNRWFESYAEANFGKLIAKERR